MTGDFWWPWTPPDVVPQSRARRFSTSQAFFSLCFIARESYMWRRVIAHYKPLLSFRRVVEESRRRCLESPFFGFWHANSLEQCLTICVKEHPLCKAVSFNPGMEIGLANCWPKTGFNEALPNPGAKQGIIHSATLPNFAPIDGACSNNTSYKPGDDEVFTISCDQVSSGGNIISLHTQNLTACMNACNAKRGQCFDLVFDTTLQSGYENCYLKNSTGNISTQEGYMHASYSGRSAPKERSKAWIAGPIVGGLVILVVVACAVFWWRRKKRSTESDLAELDSTKSQYPEAYGTALSEVDGVHPTGEMPASTKYAHMLPTNEKPVELPRSMEHKQKKTNTTSPQELS